MILTLVGKTHPAKLRCFAFPYPMATHLKSRTPFASFSEIRDTVNRKSAELGHDAFLFVSQRHLPHELRFQLNDLDGYPEFCRYISFCKVIYELKMNAFTYPSFSSKRHNATRYPVPGFPVTQPRADSNVIINDAWSFGETELREFLGDYFDAAGRMIFLSVSFSPRILRGDLQRYLQALINPLNDFPLIPS